jgi:hypothetical protein
LLSQQAFNLCSAISTFTEPMARGGLEGPSRLSSSVVMAVTSSVDARSDLRYDVQHGGADCMDWCREATARLKPRNERRICDPSTPKDEYFGPH